MHCQTNRPAGTRSTEVTRRPEVARGRGRGQRSDAEEDSRTHGGGNAYVRVLGDKLVIGRVGAEETVFPVVRDKPAQNRQAPPSPLSPFSLPLSSPLTSTQILLPTPEAVEPNPVPDVPSPLGVVPATGDGAT